MIGLIKKDLYQLKHNWCKWYVMSLIISSIFIANLFLKRNSIIFITFVSLLMINNMQSLFIKDSSNNWLNWLNIIGMKNYMIIAARYVTLCIISFFIIVINIIYMLFGIKCIYGMSIKDIGIITGVSFIVFMIYGLIVFPFLYAFRQNGLTVSVCVIFGSAFCIIKFANGALVLQKLINTLDTATLILMATVSVFIICFVSYILSYSVYIYQQKHQC